MLKAVIAVSVGLLELNPLGAQATPTASRSFSADPVDAGGEVTVTITADGYGAFGDVAETLPAGFTYLSSSLPDDQVMSVGQTVKFALIGGTPPTTFIYTVPDFGPPTKIVCHRDFRNWRRPGERFSSSGDIPESMREFFAEEAGRAAAVSYQALSRSEAFQGFRRLGDKGTTKDNGEMWRLLNLAAWEIGVNRSAVVKQLDLEGRIIVEQKGGRKLIHLQPAFSTLMGGR